MNKIFLVGNLTRDPELRTTQSGVSVCSFGLAVGRRRKADGHPEVDFFSVTAWRELAENCAKYLVKGRKCCVIGEFHLREYTASDGARRMSADVQADQVEFLPSAERQASVQTTAAYCPPGIDGFTQVDEGELPF